MNHWLSASLDAGHIVAHIVKASFGWVDLNDNFELTFATSQFILPVRAVWLAIFDKSGLWIFTFLDHLIDILRLFGKVCIIPWFVDHPSWGEPATDTFSHCVILYFKLIIIYLRLESI